MGFDNKWTFINVKWEMNGHSVILKIHNMSPRPRENSDAELFAATARVMQRRGPAQLTLADVAKEAGVVPATLIQRFGSKRNLLLATCKGYGDTAAQFAAARQKHKSPLKALVELYVECSSVAATPEAMANGLAYLQNDLTDPDFRAVTLAQFRDIHEETEKMLEEAVIAGELARCDIRGLTRCFHHVYQGSMLSWAVFREGALSAWLRRDLESLLRPYRVSPKSKQPAKGKKDVRRAGSRADRRNGLARRA
jgi:AcrR family transcriptional regulator